MYIENYLRIQEEAIKMSGNPDIKLIAVSKRHPFSTLQKAYEEGILLFGENSVQEGLAKIESFREINQNLSFHHIGPLQKGNLRKLFGNFQSTQGVGSLNSWNELVKRSLKEESKLDYFIQINLTGEDSKSGLTRSEWNEALNRWDDFKSHNLNLMGLMTMGPSDGDPILTRKVFRELRSIRDEINPQWILSMGMSGDYKIALEEGSGMIRIGTAIFGERNV